MIYINENKAIDFRHEKIEDNRREVKDYWCDELVPMKRITVCDIVEVGEERPYKIVATGVARCDSRDNFNKERGRKMSLKLALKDAGTPRDERRVIWSAYHNR